MCGIAGALVYDSVIARLDSLESVINESSTRGVDSFGVVRWSPSEGFTRHCRLGVKSTGWFEEIGKPSPDEPTYYLHTSRAEPTTEWKRHKTNDDIPPFISNGVAVAHNGIIANDKELAEKYKIERKTLIDTAVVPPMIHRIGVWKTMAELRGGIAMAVLDSNRESLFLCRNFMPLSLSWEPGIICFASEAAFFPSHDLPIRSAQIWELPPYRILELSEHGFRPTVEWGKNPDYDSKSKWIDYPSLIWREQ